MMELWRNQRIEMQLVGKPWQHRVLIRMRRKQPVEQLTHAPAEEPLASDLLIGAPAIAAFIGVSKKRLYYYVSKKRLPVGRLGKSLIASKAKLRRAIRDLV